MYIDSHAHLFDEDFRQDLHEVILRARDAGVDRIVVPGINVETSREALELTAKYEHIYACVGYHPHEASKATDKFLGEIESLSAEPKVVAIGEIGLDYHYDFSPRDGQIAVFKAQIDLAFRKDLPIVVHTRESLKDTMDVVEQFLMGHLKWKPGGGDTADSQAFGRGVFHCFTGSASEARKLFGIGFMVSYPGIVTFKNSPVTQTIAEIGYSNIMVETDSPYMAPVPIRGKRNEPANIVHVGRKIAELLNVSETEVARVTSLNALKLFGFEQRRP